MKAKTIADLDRASAGFDLFHGDILLLEAPKSVNLNDNLVYVGNNRSIYFAQNTGKYNKRMTLFEQRSHFVDSSDIQSRI